MIRSAVMAVRVKSAQAVRALKGVGSLAVSVGRKTDKLQRRLDRLDASQLSQSVAGGLKKVAVAGGLALGAVTALSAANFTSFEAEMSVVEAVTRSGETAMDSLTAKSRELGESTVFSATQAAEGMAFLGRAGFDTEQILGSIGPALDLAAAGALDLGRSADIMSNVMSTWSLEAAEAGRVADVMALSAASANTTVHQLGEAFKFVGPVASALTVPIEETAAAVGVLSDRGIQAEMAGTGLRRIYQGLVAPTTKARSALAKYGLTVEDVNPANHDLVDILGKLKDLTTEDIFTLFAQRGGTAFLALKSGADDVARLTEEFNAAEGASGQMAATMMDNLHGSVLALKSAAESVSIEMGTGMAPNLRQATEDWTEFLRANRETALVLGQQVGKALKLVSDAVLFLSENSYILKAALMALLALRVYSTVTRWFAAFKAGTVAVKLFGVALGPVTVAVMALGAAVALTESTIDHFANKWAQQTREIVAEGANLRESADFIRGLDDRVAEALEKGTLKSLGADLEELGARLEAAEHRASAAGAGIERWNSALSSAKAAGAAAEDVQHLSDQLVRSKIEKRAAGNEVAALNEAIARLTPRYAELEAQGASATGEFERQKAELEALAAAHGEVADGVKKTADALSLLQAEVEKARQIGAVAREFGLSLGDATKVVDTLLKLGKDPATSSTRLEVVELVESLRALETVMAVLAGEQIQLPKLEVDAEPQFPTTQPVEVQEGDLSPEGVRDRWGEALETIGEHWEGMANVAAEALASAFGGFDGEVGRVLDGINQITSSLKAANSGNPVAAAAVGQGVADIAIGAGVFQGQRGEGRFGGELSGDYSELGGQIGAIAGSLIPVVGTLVGGVIGTVVGGMIKSGADEGLGIVRQKANEAILEINADEGGLGAVVAEVGGALIGVVDSLEQLLNTDISLGAGGIGIKVRDDIITVFANGLRREFTEIEDATEFAVLEALKTADFGGGLSPEVQAVLEGQAFESIEQLQRQLALAISIEEMGIPEAQRGLRQLRRDFVATAEEAMALGIPVKNLFAEMAAQFAKSRDEILGIEKDAYAEISERAQAWNAERAELAEQAEEKLTVLLETLARAEQAEAAGGSFENLLDSVTGALVSSGAFAADELSHLTGRLAQLGGTAGAGADLLREQIAAIQSMLQQLPAAITEGEIRQAASRRRGRGSRGNSGAAQREEQRNELRRTLRLLESEMGESAQRLSESILDLKERRREILKLGGLGEDFADRLVSAESKKIVAEFLAPFRETTRSAGESAGQTSYRKLRERQEEDLEAARAAQAALDEVRGGADPNALGAMVADVLAATEAELAAFGESVIDGLGLPMEAVRDRLASTGDAIELMTQLLDDGVISQERFNEVMGEMSQQAKLGILSLAADLEEELGNSEAAAEIRAQADQLSLELKILELELMYQQYEAWGLLSDETGTMIEDLIARLRDPENFAPPEAEPEGPVAPQIPASSAGGSPVDASEEAAQVVARIRESLDAWRELPMHDLMREATRMTAQRAQLLEDATVVFGDQYNELVAEIDAAWEQGVGGFVDKALARYEDLGGNRLVADSEKIREDFDAMHEAFEELGVNAEAWNRLAVAEAAAWDDFWAKATSGLQSFVDELDVEDPRISQEQRFLEAQARFRDLRARAAGGDLEALDQLAGAARAYNEASRSYLGGGVGTHAVLDELGSVRELIDSNPLVDATTGAVQEGNDILGDIRTGIYDLKPAGPDITVFRPTKPSLDQQTASLAVTALSRAVSRPIRLPATALPAAAGPSQAAPLPIVLPTATRSDQPKGRTDEYLGRLVEHAEKAERREERKSGQGKRPPRKSEEARQMEEMNRKLDQLIRILASQQQQQSGTYRGGGYGS